MKSPATVTLRDGRVVPRPPCPDCHSTAKRCRRPSGHEAADWHRARYEALDQAIAALDLEEPPAS